MISRLFTWKRAPWLLVLVVYSLIVGEIALRLVAPVPLIPRFVTGAPYGIRMNIPNSTYWHTTSEASVQVRINGQGMRADTDVTYSKPAETCRVLLFGDSVMMGFEVDYENTFAYLLDQHLRKASYRSEVLNLAVSGFGTAEMLTALRAEGVKYKPDVVIFQWHSTDPKNNASARLFEVRDEQLLATGRTYLPGVAVRDWLSRFGAYDWIVQNSQLYTAIRERAASWYKTAVRSYRKFELSRDTAQKPAPKTPERNAASELDLLLLERSKAEAEAAGARFLLLDTPGRRSRTKFKSAFDFLPQSIHDRMATLTPLHRFERSAGNDVLLFREKGHGHYTELGNGLVTDAVFDYLTASGWLAGCRNK